MTITTNAITVTTSPTPLTAAGADGKSGTSGLPFNDGAVTVFLGGSDVAASGAKKGVPVLAGTYGPGLDLSNGEILYGVVASGTCSVCVLEAGR